MHILIFIIILLVLVLVHEAGHFFSAKYFGIRVDEFGFGWPPKIFSIKKGETEYSFNLLPIGGFVKIFGENPDDENTRGPDAIRSFVNKPKHQQVIVLFAGIFANFLLAWVLFSFSFMSGLPMSTSNESLDFTLQNKSLVVIRVAKESPAEIAGLQAQDKIVRVQTVSILNSQRNFDYLTNINPQSLHDFVYMHQNEKIKIGYVRNKSKNIQYVEVTPSIYKKLQKTPSIGISMDEIGFVKLPVGSALWEGVKMTWKTTENTAVGLYKLIADSVQGKGSFKSITGPVGIVGIVGDAYKFGFAYLLSFTAVISVNLAIINLIPFPALDGGRLLFLLIEKIKKSRINPKITNTLNTIGFIILILLMLLITFHDIIQLI